MTFNNYKFFLTLVLSMCLPAFGNMLPKAVQNGPIVNSVGTNPQMNAVNPQTVSVDKHLFDEIMAKFAALNIKVANMSVEAVLKHLEGINDGLAAQFGPILNTLVLLVSPNGEGVVLKKQNLENAISFDIEKFKADNKKAIEEMDNPSQPQIQQETEKESSSAA